MVRKKSFYRRALALLTVLALFALAGCGAKQTGAQDPAGTAQSAPAAQEPQQPQEQPQQPQQPQEQPRQPQQPQEQPQQPQEPQPAPPADDAVHVDSVEGLLEAIAPDTKIVLEPGRYDLTDFLRDYPNARDQEAWNEEHPYVKLGMVFDGVEITICEANGLCVRGGGDDPSKTELVTEPRYAAVLNFDSCADVELAYLTVGHTETGDCSGNVLDLENCFNIRLDHMDIYGCGVYGVSAVNCCSELNVTDSVIRDCAYGALWIEEGVGDFTFTGCDFHGSPWGGLYEPTKLSRLIFVDCSFGQNETNGWYFRNTALFENCRWAEEVTSYPDREDTLENSYGFFPDRMEQRPVDDLTAYSTWLGFCVTGAQGELVEYLGLMGQDGGAALIASLELDYSTGEWTVTIGRESLPLETAQTDEGVTYLRSADGEVRVELYELAGEDYLPWLKVHYQGSDYWFY